MKRRGKRSAPVLSFMLMLLCLISAGGHLMRRASAAHAQKKLEGARLERARSLFADNCVRCHGADGRGQVPMGRVFNAPNLTDPGWWKKERPTDRRLTNSIRKGRNDERMPGFGNQLSRADIATLVAYVRTFNGK